MRITEKTLRKIISTEARRALVEKGRVAPAASSLTPQEILPLELDSVDPQLAKVMVKAGTADGAPDDDVVQVSPASFAAAELKPAQTTMVLSKAVGMAIGMCSSGKIGGNLGAVVSSDNHIMDGHHRWAATIMADPSGTVSGYQAEIPGEKLIPVLNVLTKGMFGKGAGNPGKGSISEFTYENVKKILRQYVEKGTSGEHGMSPEKVKAALTKQFGSPEDGIEAMANNVEQMSKDVPPWAPDRSQMPVIDPREVPKAAAALSKGAVDLARPFASVTAKAAGKAGTTKESRHFVTERWQRLAGIVKG